LSPVLFFSFCTSSSSTHSPSPELFSSTPGKIEQHLRHPPCKAFNTLLASLSKVMAMLGVADRPPFGSHLGVASGIVESSHHVVRRDDTGSRSMTDWGALFALDLVSAFLIAFAGMMFGKSCCPVCRPLVSDTCVPS
jgi:hypothetical protein